MKFIATIDKGKREQRTISARSVKDACQDAVRWAAGLGYVSADIVLRNAVTGNKVVARVRRPEMAEQPEAV